MRTLDSYKLTNVAFIKIDVEGHEEAVLRGGLETLRREMPNLLIEIEERHAPGSLARVLGMLDQIGYAGFFVKERAVVEIEHFELSRDQVEENSSTGHYINNFLFFPRGRASALAAQATLLLA